MRGGGFNYIDVGEATRTVGLWQAELSARRPYVLCHGEWGQDTCTLQLGTVFLGGNPMDHFGEYALLTILITPFCWLGPKRPIFAKG